jgi:hypothetical protein
MTQKLKYRVNAGVNLDVDSMQEANDKLMKLTEALEVAGFDLDNASVYKRGSYDEPF